MREIKADLEERLTNAKARRDQIKSKYEEDLEQVDEEIDALSHLIDVEDRKQGNGADRARRRILPQKVSDFLLDKLANGAIWSTGQLRDEALEAGLLKNTASPGRSIHGSLLGLMKAGKIEYAGKAKWKVAKNAPQH